MRYKMIFKFGVTVIVVVAIVIYFLMESKNESSRQANSHNIDKLAKDSYSADSENLKPAKDQRVDINSRKQAENIHSNGVNKENGPQNIPKNNNNINSVHDSQNGKDNLQDQNSASKSKNTGALKSEPVFSSSKVMKEGSIHLSVVACGERFEETMVVLKSAVLLTASHLQYHIFCDKDLQFKFKDHLEFWPEKYRSKIDYWIYDITFPEGNDADSWRKLFKPCASQRLFIPQILKNVDSIVYVDTDVLFLSPIEKLYSFFTKFNATQLAALAPESEDTATGWYNRFARHPYYGILGVNSGVMLMNLTRIRHSGWLHDIAEYYKEYKLQLTWGDQDLINIYFHYHPQELYIFPCEWNYRPDHCMYMSVCKGIDQTGVYILHGSRRVMHNEKQPAFKAVYTAFKEHKFSSTIEFGLLVHLKRLLQDAQSTNCGKLAPIYTMQLQQYSENIERKQIS